MSENGNRKLTARELQVLALVGEGKTSKQVAEALHLSVETVANHRKHICRKVGLHSTAELVAYAVRAAKPDHSQFTAE
ncbi:MAG TPA: helix-turn-helix transcriptional regulator [Candidatus Sulfopaludibacter sp.]|nr:helix-turn-helix transcriptional regulator [Candidatus Sulfopaludibacter sp.]